MRHKLLHLCLFFLLIGATFAQAISPPPMPQLIKGRVYINDKPAPIGTNITININGKTQSAIVQNPGEYSVVLGSEETGTIEFFVNGIKANETTYTPGALSNVDLSVKSSNIFLMASAILVLIILVIVMLSKKKRKR